MFALLRSLLDFYKAAAVPLASQAQFSKLAEGLTVDIMSRITTMFAPLEARVATLEAGLKAARR